jgi:hypothetical protein
MCASRSAYLSFGAPDGRTGTPSDVTNGLPSGARVTITANNANERLGGAPSGNGTVGTIYTSYHSVGELGNIDGSGRNAFAIGSPGAINPALVGSSADGAGAVYVLYSQTGWSDSLALPVYDTVSKTWSGGNLDGTNGFVIYSSSFANMADGTTKKASDLGFAISSVGDVNGDGIDDFLIGAPMANDGAGAVFLVFGQTGGLPGASTGVVDLDQLVAAGQGSAFGTQGTAIKYTGTTTTTQQSEGGSMLGTDVTGGDFSGTGIHGYAFGAWGETVGGLKQAGQSYIYNGTTAYLTQSYTIEDNQVYYAGVHTVGAAQIVNGVDLIATGPGNNNWVHGIGTDTTGTTSTTVQHDVVSGGAGDDHIGIIGTNFTSLNGGGGWNTLVFEGSNLTLNLDQMGLRVQNFAEFDLNNQTNNASVNPQQLFMGRTTGNTLELSLSDVLNGAASGAIGFNANNTPQRMTILGDSESTVRLDGTSSLAASNWHATGQETIGGVLFDVYHNSTTTNVLADLLIQHGVTVV